MRIRSAAIPLVAALAATDCTSANSSGASSSSARPSTQAPFMNTLTPEEQREGWVLLFDGSTTNGWRNYRRTDVNPKWQVVNGVLTMTGSGAGDIITVGKYRSFDLVLDWRIAPGGNSGLFYRATEEGNSVWQSAPEMQILDDAGHSDGSDPITSAGSVFAVYEAPRGVVKPAGEWNTARVLVNGNHVEHWLNGQKLFEYELGGAEWNDRVARSKFRTIPYFGKAAEGHIGLQDHGDLAEFRNIKLRVLP